MFLRVLLECLLYIWCIIYAYHVICAAQNENDDKDHSAALAIRMLCVH